MRFVCGEGLFAEDVFARGEGQHAVLVVVGVRGGDVDDVDVGVRDEFGVGAVCGGGVGDSVGFDEFLRAGGGAGRGDGGDGVRDVGDGAGGGVDQEVFGE